MRTATAALVIGLTFSAVSGCGNASDQRSAGTSIPTFNWNTPLPIGQTFAIEPTQAFTFASRETDRDYLTASVAWDDYGSGVTMPAGEVPAFGIIHSRTSPHGQPSQWDGAVVWAFRDPSCTRPLDDTDQSTTNPDGSPCISWTFLDASTGMQVVSLGQVGWLRATAMH